MGPSKKGNQWQVYTSLRHHHTLTVKETKNDRAMPPHPTPPQNFPFIFSQKKGWTVTKTWTFLQNHTKSKPFVVKVKSIIESTSFCLYTMQANEMNPIFAISTFCFKMDKHRRCISITWSWKIKNKKSKYPKIVIFSVKFNKFFEEIISCTQ